MNHFLEKMAQITPWTNSGKHCSASNVGISIHPPFGILMPGRSYSSPVYRYGFNGQEKDDEVAGSGNINTAKFWEYDTRLGRRWNLDPVPQITISDYSILGNNPLIFTDVLGDSKDSRHIDKNGNVIAEYDDGDNSVYKHQTAMTKKDVDYWRAKFHNISGNGVKVGEMSMIGTGVFDIRTFKPSVIATPKTNIWPAPSQEVSPLMEQQAQSSGGAKSSVGRNTQLGLEGWEHAIGPSLYSLGANILETRGKFSGATPGTSIASKTLSKAIPTTFTKVLGKEVGTKVATTIGTNVIGRAVGRFVPVLGWGLTIYDAETFMINNQESIQQGMQARDNFIQQGLMPLR